VASRAVVVPLIICCGNCTVAKTRDLKPVQNSDFIPKPPEIPNTHFISFIDIQESMHAFMTEGGRLEDGLLAIRSAKMRNMIYNMLRIISKKSSALEPLAGDFVARGVLGCS
jgi:hypothetical protein